MAEKKLTKRERDIETIKRVWYNCGYEDGRDRMPRKTIFDKPFKI